MRTWFVISSKLRKEIYTLVDEVFENIFNCIVNVILLTINFFSWSKNGLYKVIREHWIEFPVLFSRFLLSIIYMKSESEVAQSCPNLCDPMDCSLPGSSVHGIFQARVLEWGTIAFSVWMFYSVFTGGSIHAVWNVVLPCCLVLISDSSFSTLSVFW